MAFRILLIVLFVLVLYVIISCVRVVPQAYAYVVEFLGSYRTTWEHGLHLKAPFVERIANKVSLKEQVCDFAPSSVITKDNVTMKIDSVVYFKIFDPRLYTYGVDRPLSAMENLNATTLRNIIGGMELDQTLTSRDIINAQMLKILDEATDAWGIKVTRVELKNIIPPAEIQGAMEKQMKAERERREAILKAEGEKASAVLVAEGEKEAKILAAEADKQSAILRAEAVKEAKIRESEGEAQAILAIQQAKAKGIELINASNPGEATLRMRSLEAFEKAADGKATKLIIPSDIQGAVGVAAALADTVKNN